MRTFCVAIVVMFIGACTNSNTIPAGIIPKQKMETILSQLMQSDEYANTQIMKDSSKKMSTEKMRIYQQVFDLNNVSLKEFKDSYQFYMGHPDIARTIFDSVSARASRQRALLYKPLADSAKPKPASVLSLPAAKPVPRAVDSLHSKLSIRALRARQLKLSGKKLKPTPPRHPVKSSQ